MHSVNRESTIHADSMDEDLNLLHVWGSTLFTQADEQLSIKVPS